MRARRPISPETVGRFYRKQPVRLRKRPSIFDNRLIDFASSRQQDAQSFVCRDQTLQHADVRLTAGHVLLKERYLALASGNCRIELSQIAFRLGKPTEDIPKFL